METAMFVSFYRSIVVFSLSYFERGGAYYFLCVSRRAVLECRECHDPSTQHTPIRPRDKPLRFLFSPERKTNNNHMKQTQKIQKKNKKVVGFPSWPWYIRARRGVAPARLAASAQHAVHLAVSKAKETVRTLSDSFFCVFLFISTLARDLLRHTH